MPPDPDGPSGPSVWDTLPWERTVLMVCRSLTSTIRLLETHDLLRDDFRLRFAFAIDPGTPFGAGVERLLRQAGVDRIVDWSEVAGLRPDVTLAASENVDPTVLAGRIIVLPHGVGFNKYVPTADGTTTRLAGLPSAAALDSGRVRVVLAHPDQDTQLRAACPEIAGYTVVTGDPTLDRLTASLPLRDRYRDQLRTDDRHRLVLLSSTWNTTSAMGQSHTLPSRLLAALPADEYRLCLALHPNIWDLYGARAIRLHLASALDAGLLLLPPRSAWQAAMVASDLVIADRGSLSLYAAALGKPLLLAGNDADTVPGTPMADLAAAVPHLAEDRPLAAQLESAITGPPSARAALRETVNRSFGHRGEATSRLRQVLYRELGLDPPDDDPLPRVPDPTVEHRGPSSFRVLALGSDHATTLVRYPASVRPGGGDEHLAVTDDEPDLRLLEQASVLCRLRRTDHAGARRWATTALADYPGARLAAAGTTTGCLVVCRDGRHALLTADDADITMLASLAYERLTTGRLHDQNVLLSLAGRELAVAITTG